MVCVSFNKKIVNADESHGKGKPGKKQAFEMTSERRKGRLE